MSYNSKYKGSEVEALLDKVDTLEIPDVSEKLDKTEAASTYLTKNEAASTYLGKTAKAADATKADSATKATQDGSGNNIVNTYATKTELSAKGTYTKPSTGIPKSDLASAVQTSLGKADTALQSYTEQYKGTVTGVKVNGSTKTPSSGTVDIGNVVTGVKINGSTKSPSSGTVDLGTVITAHQDISGKQDKLVSGTNIKTINGQSILGEGDLSLESGGGSYGWPFNFIDQNWNDTVYLEPTIVHYAMAGEGTGDWSFDLARNMDASDVGKQWRLIVGTEKESGASVSLYATDVIWENGEPDFNGGYYDITFICVETYVILAKYTRYNR
jgi:hypothetical protein